MSERKRMNRIKGIEDKGKLIVKMLVINLDLILDTVKF